MDETSLAGKRILLTHADQFMGPALAEVLAGRGADVVADRDPLADPDAAATVVARAGRVDVLVEHLALPAPSTPVEAVDDAEWRAVFAALVDPLPRLVRAVVPQMKARRTGRILVVGSASALRGMKRASTYSAARGAQLAYVQSAGVELASFGIQVNAVAQNFVDIISAISSCCDRMIWSASWRARGSVMRARSLVRTAIEWCGIMAFIQATSSMVAWLRTSARAPRNTAALVPTMARFARRFRYMERMKASMIMAIAAPIRQAMYRRWRIELPTLARLSKWDLPRPKIDPLIGVVGHPGPPVTGTPTLQAEVLFIGGRAYPLRSVPP